MFVLNRYRFVLAHSEIYRILFDLMNYGMTNRVGPVFSEKMKNASTHHEIEYAEFIKSKIFVRSQRPRGRANHHHAMAENFRCNTVDLPYRGVLAGFIDESAEPRESESEIFEAFAMHLPGHENYQSYSTHAARTHASAAAGMSWHAYC